jgi:hypothetical protein
VDAGEETGVALAGVGDAFDEPAGAESAAIVGHLSAGDGLDVEQDAKRPGPDYVGAMASPQ